MKRTFFFFSIFAVGILSMMTGYHAVLAAKIEKVRGVRVSDVGNTSATLTWNAATRAKKYVLQSRDANGNVLSKIKSKKATLTLTDLTPDTLYHYRVRAVRNKEQKGPWSATVDFTTASEDGESEDDNTIVNVSIDDFAFSPESVTISAGDTVRWTDRDSASHTVTSDDGAFASSSALNNATYEVTFDEPGTYAYHCSPHPFITGTIIVQ